MSTLDEAREALGKAVETAQRWQATVAAREAELADLEARAGAEAFAAEDGDEAAARLGNQLAGLRSTVATSRQAAEHASAALVEARRDCLRAAAEAQSGRAQRLTDEADRHHEKTVKLLAQVAEHERVDGWSDVPAPVGFSEGLAGGVIERNPPQTHTSRLRAGAQAAADAVRQAEQVAGGESLDAAQFERAMAVADPDGPEARAVADRKAAAEREQAEARERERRFIELRKQMDEAFDAELVSAGAARDMTRAHNMRVAQLPTPDPRLSTVEQLPGRYVELLGRLLAGGSSKPDVVQAAHERAARAVGKVVKASGADRHGVPVG